MPFLLAGCFGECGPYDTVIWSDASLYEAMTRVEHRTSGETAGIANGSALDLGGAVVTTLTWQPSQGTSRPSVAPHEEVAHVRLLVGRIQAQATSDEEARAIVAAFLANLSAEDDATRARIAEAVVANKTEGLRMYEPSNDSFRTVAWEYSAEAFGAWRVEETLRGHRANVTASSSQAGMSQLQVGPYLATISFPMREATLEGIPFRVDASGAAEAVPGERGSGTQQTSIERVRAILTAHGLPAPGHAEVRTVVC